MLAHFADAIRPEVRAMASEASQQLQDLVTRRQQFVEMMSAEKARQPSTRVRTGKSIEQHIDWLKQQIQDLDTQIEQLIAQSDQWQRTR